VVAVAVYTLDMGENGFKGKAVEPLHCRVSRAVVDEVIRRAAVEDRTVSAWVRARVIRALLEEPEPIPYPPSTSASES